MGSLFLLQGISPTQGSNPGLPYCRWILYQLSHEGSPRILEWVAYPFSSGSSRPSNWTGVSCIAGGFFTNWATREAHAIYNPLINTKQLFLLKYFALVAQWLRIHLPMQETWVQSLVWVDAICHEETKLVCNNYWACVLETRSHSTTKEPTAMTSSHTATGQEPPTHSN